MKFQSALDELQHWLGLLNVDVALGVPQRHLVSTARLCFLLIERIEREPVVDVATFRRLELQLLDLQRAIAKQASPASPNPVARRVGRLRVIEGGGA